MKPTSLPENPTNGVVRRTLRGMDGRISHVETLAARWSPSRIDDAIAAAVAPLKAEIDALKAKLDALTVAPAASDAAATVTIDQ